MALEFRSLALEMQASLRLRPCKSYKYSRCQADCSWVSDDCSQTVKESEAKAFLQTRGVSSEYDQDKLLQTMAELGFLKIRQCQRGSIFKDYFTEDGAPIILFLQ